MSAIVWRVDGRPVAAGDVVWATQLFGPKFPERFEITDVVGTLLQVTRVDVQDPPRRIEPGREWLLPVQVFPDLMERRS